MVCHLEIKNAGCDAAAVKVMLNVILAFHLLSFNPSFSPEVLPLV